MRQVRYVAVVTALLFAAACGKGELTRAEAGRLFLASIEKANPNNGNPNGMYDPNNKVEVTGLQKFSDTKIQATYTFTLASPARRGQVLRCKDTFTLYDDGWRLDDGGTCTI